jgi:transcriptional regulator with XRE-family HTH domain
MAPPSYGSVLARNIRAARAGADISQQVLAARMQSLGFGAWLHQTVANVEKEKRRVTAEEIFGLALALNTTVDRLMRPLPEDGKVGMPSGVVLPWQSAAITISGPDPNGEAGERLDRYTTFHRGIRWDGGTLLRVASRHERGEGPGEGGDW